MAYEMKPMTGSLFLETEKKDPKHADWKGSLKMTDGSEYWASGYNRKTKGGKDVLNVLLQKKNTTYEKRAPEDKNNLGTLEANPKKTDQKHPDRKGKINVEGTDYWLSAWDNVAQTSGKKYLKLTLSPIEARVAPQNEAAWAQPKTDAEAGFGGLDIGVPPDFDDSPPAF
jgi:hypothetical protein